MAGARNRFRLEREGRCGRSVRSATRAISAGIRSTIGYATGNGMGRSVKRAVLGGDVMLRATLSRPSVAIANDLIAGEEPDFASDCARQVAYLAAGCGMTLHDAAMTRFSQWWRRASCRLCLRARRPFAWTSAERLCLGITPRLVVGTSVALVCLAAGLLVSRGAGSRC